MSSLPRLCLVGWIALLAGSGAPAALAADNTAGEILIGELNCAACHEASPPERERLASAQAPVLGAQGLQITPQWLRSYLRDPQGAKPGTTMPDSLHGLSAADKTEAADALTQYLVSLQPPSTAESEYDAASAAKGRTLYHTIGCVACHSPREGPPRAAGGTANAPENITEAQQNSAPLGQLAAKTAVPRLAAFLKDPLAIRPSGRMPSLNLGDAEATAIAMYLLEDQKTSQTPGSVPGVNYEYFEQTLARLPKFERLPMKAKGTASQFNLSVRQRDDDFALRFQGNLTVPIEGEYTFATESDDGSRLMIDDKEVVDNDGIHALTEKSGRIVLTRGEHAIAVVYFNASGGRGLNVYWQGPNLPREEIPAASLSHVSIPMRPTGAEEAFALDPAKVERGRQLFASLNCNACHSLTGAGRPATKLAELDPARPDGCIGAAPAADRPSYLLGTEARQAIQAALAKPSALAEPLTASERVEHTLAALNCYACHHREQRGGPEAQRREYFVSNGEADLGDEGRFPPHLDGVGLKLRPSAMEAVLWKAAVARPYLATRMPQFGRANVGELPAAFDQADDPGDNPASRAEPPPVPNGPSLGRRLAGLKGLGCIACHAFNGHPSLGVPAIDLTLTYARVKPGWFHRYLIDPQALRPGTRMPSFWPDGKAANTEIYHGDTDAQIAALREFLAKGKFADLPEGLIAPKMELVADKETIIYRNFVEGAGPRAIGVGYPEKANLVFDADTLTIPLIWQGAFIDASRHRTGRGLGAEPPLGVNVVSWTPGPPLALLANADAPWPAATGKPAGYQFRGYQLCDEERPAFRYTFGDIAVEDEPRAIQGEVDASLRRTLTFGRAAGAIPGLYFRAAAGTTIDPLPTGEFLVNRQVTVKLASGQAPFIRQNGGHAELLVPLELAAGQAKLEETLTW